MHVLITTNNFWVGGRETYIATYMRWLKQRGYTASLIASSLIPSAPELSVFDDTLMCGPGDYSLRWRLWLQKADEFVTKRRPAMIWAHHFDLFPAWLISQCHRIPLLTTFHGPLIDNNRPNDPMQALGMTLTIYRGSAVSGVSKEIVSGIKQLDKKLPGSYIIPNTININESSARSHENKIPIKFVLITRRDKLEHMRNAALLFHAYRKKIRGSSLTIIAGNTPEDKGEDRKRANIFSKIEFASNFLGGKWCYRQGASFLYTLSKIFFQGYSASPIELIQRSDVVLGMGRVVLEGLAEGKQSVLIGYDKICGTVNSTTIDEYQIANFSGRGILPRTAEDVCSELLGRRNKKSEDPSYMDKISVDAWGDRIREWMTHIVNFSDFKQGDVELATTLSRNILVDHCREEDIFSTACSAMTSEELSSFYRLSMG